MTDIENEGPESVVMTWSQQPEGNFSMGKVLGNKPYILLVMSVDDEDENQMNVQVETGGGIPTGKQGAIEVGEMLTGLGTMVTDNPDLIVVPDGDT